MITHCFILSNAERQFEHQGRSRIWIISKIILALLHLIRANIYICLLSVLYTPQCTFSSWSQVIYFHPDCEMTARGHVSSPVTSKNNSGLSSLFAYMIQQNYSALTRVAPEIAALLQDRMRRREREHEKTVPPSGCSLHTCKWAWETWIERLQWENRYVKSKSEEEKTIEKSMWQICVYKVLGSLTAAGASDIYHANPSMAHLQRGGNFIKLKITTLVWWEEKHTEVRNAKKKSLTSQCH